MRRIVIPSHSSLLVHPQPLLECREGGINWYTGIEAYTLPYTKYITNKNLLYSTGNSTQYSVMVHMGIEFKKEQIYVYV